MVEVKFKKLDGAAITPSYATDGSGCFDITAIERTSKAVGKGWAIYRTGLAFEIPVGKAMILYGRSGLAFNDGIRLATCSSVIDSDYRGELIVKLQSDGLTNGMPMAGQRIAQGMIVDAPHVKFVEVDELSDTKRGEGGMGSTG